MNNSIALNELEKIFNFFNKAFWSDHPLESPMIVINPTGRVPLYGWCTVQKIWKSTDGSGNEYYEICICAEALNRSYVDIAETVLHEMIHLHNLYLEIKDTSINGRYHNKRYKKSAEDHGLNVTKDIKFGWSNTTLSDSTNRLLTDLNKNEDAFKIYRQLFIKNKVAAKKMYTYRCSCDRLIRSEIEDDQIRCNRCDEIMYRKGK